MNVPNRGTNRSITNSLSSVSHLKKIKAAIQLAVFVMIIVMLVMNIFKSGGNDPQTQQMLYKLMEMPSMGALAAPVHYTHVPRNTTGD